MRLPPVLNFVLPAAAALALLACDSAPTTSHDATSNLGDAWVVDVQPDIDLDGFADVPQCDPAQLQIWQVRPWPGNGVQILASLQLPPDTDVTPALERTDGSRTGLFHGPAEVTGITGIVVVSAADLGAAQVLLDGLPQHERVALWLGGQLWAQLTEDRAYLSQRLLDAQNASFDGGGPNPNAVADALRQVEGPFANKVRQVVVVGPLGGPQPWPGEFDGVQLRWVDDETEAAAHAAGWAQLREQLVWMGGCPDLSPAEIGSAMQLWVTGELGCPISAPEPIWHMAAHSCSGPAATEDAYPYGDTVRFTFDAEQKATYDAAYAAKDESVDFPFSLTFGGDGPADGEGAIEATAHFRGQTSLDCARKSMTVNLAGGEPRRLMPGGALDEFHLLSLCKDAGFYQQVFANALLRPRGIFPLEARYVVVEFAWPDRVENRGVYRMLEHATDTLVADHLDLNAVIRRRFDPEDKPEDVKFPKDANGQAPALAAYEALAETSSEMLEQHLGLDAYLRWLAFNTFMKNGDYVDEAFFYGTHLPDGWYFRVMGWDPDDLFSACHHSGKWALEDPWGLMYCAEGDLDFLIAASPELYGRFVEALEALLAELTPALLSATMDAVRAELWAVLDDDETASAMVEMGDDAAFDTASGMRAGIAALMNDTLAAAEARRVELQGLITTYRQGQAP